VFGNKEMRRIFGPKRDEVTRGCRKLHSMELRNLYSSSVTRVTKSRRLRRAGHGARVEKRNTCKLFVEKPEGNTSLGRPRHRQEAIKMDLGEVGWGCVDWIGMAQDEDL
jgi:hypothetical protein